MSLTTGPCWPSFCWCTTQRSPALLKKFYSKTMNVMHSGIRLCPQVRCTTRIMQQNKPRSCGPWLMLLCTCIVFLPPYPAQPSSASPLFIFLPLKGVPALLCKVERAPSFVSISLYLSSFSLHHHRLSPGSDFNANKESLFLYPGQAL